MNDSYIFYLYIKNFKEWLYGATTGLRQNGSLVYKDVIQKCLGSQFFFAKEKVDLGTVVGKKLSPTNAANNYNRKT